MGSLATAYIKIKYQSQNIHILHVQRKATNNQTTVLMKVFQTACFTEILLELKPPYDASAANCLWLRYDKVCNTEFSHQMPKRFIISRHISALPAVKSDCLL